ncbi:cg30 [Euproctis pseudoconspersa nucleopolyhedrovirus]|uniref:Cg30 n=1 Tax=Euproctis pseudoconspersa nucleopolyhedrovirus TaxID=307467 RepID=C3TWY3_9ABAC|nr:cg30 [Euproctis pseudoconspersa nucleopolyhedrovirus]ACO53525.1 cg30 [Euproctis pseudoconspersa nucleopolyhedrovirus]QUJ09265.1 cg30 protein [Gynaephora ruoergensis nucleopolyhedrovirus]
MNSLTVSCCVCFANNKIVYKNKNKNYLYVMPLASLQCGHSFCISCINLIKIGISVKCPLCRCQSDEAVMYSINRNMVNLIAVRPTCVKCVFQKNGNVDGVHFAKKLFTNYIIKKTHDARLSGCESINRDIEYKKITKRDSFRRRNAKIAQCRLKNQRLIEENAKLTKLNKLLINKVKKLQLKNQKHL